eukprot:TRINITY_DN3429_c2_g2_i6.p2 TRINITY_DN3429_c2_g2~~TRINITY_DN3429_c2_g2_i6.p2  ORF type:complete len:203 (-),score=-20.86 TRINITY_DN3429_c2_g2_i6:20-628(-)
MISTFIVELFTDMILSTYPYVTVTKQKQLKKYIYIYDQHTVLQCIFNQIIQSQLKNMIQFLILNPNHLQQYMYKNMYITCKIMLKNMSQVLILNPNHARQFRVVAIRITYLPYHWLTNQNTNSKKGEFNTQFKFPSLTTEQQLHTKFVKNQYLLQHTKHHHSNNKQMLHPILLLLFIITSFIIVPFNTRAKRQFQQNPPKKY